MSTIVFTFLHALSSQMRRSEYQNVNQKQAKAEEKKSGTRGKNRSRIACDISRKKSKVASVSRIRRLSTTAFQRKDEHTYS